MGADNRPGILEVELGERHAKSERIHQAPCEQQTLALAGGQILVQQQEVVAEVQIGLAGVALGQATASQVVDTAGGQHHQVITRQADAPTEVDFLHVGEKVLVQPAHVLIKLAAHHQTSTRRPKDALRTVVILPLVLLEVLKDAPTAVGIAVTIDIAASRAGILKHLLAIIAVMKQLGHHGAHAWMGLHVVQQGVEPTLGRTHIIVKQHRVGVHCLLNSDVIALGETKVIIKSQHLDLREFVLEHVEAVIGAAVVGDNDVGNSVIGARQNGGQVTAQQGCSIPVQYDDGDFFHP